jgi:CHAD domain-containing protein
MASGTIDVDGSATRALGRLAARFVRRAARALDSPERSHMSVHAARKDLKRARTVLCLLRPALGERSYRRENAVLRDAAHFLNAARDARMVTETLQSLRRSIPALRGDPGVAELLGALQAEQASVQRRFDEHPEDLARTQRALRQLYRRADDWRVRRHGWSLLAPALKRMYARGRRRLPITGQHASDASLHEWRKQLKYLRYALEMLKPVRPGKLARLARQAEQLTDKLGQAHDLAVLAQKAHGFANRNGVHLEPLFTIIDRRRNRLAVVSLRSGEKFFACRPRDWERQLSRYWRR